LRAGGPLRVLVHVHHPHVSGVFGNTEIEEISVCLKPLQIDALEIRWRNLCIREIGAEGANKQAGWECRGYPELRWALSTSPFGSMGDHAEGRC
jgi:hypothetical protein